MRLNSHLSLSLSRPTFRPTFQHKFVELAQAQGNPFTITRAEFREALELVGIMESDTEILDRLFSMFDKTGNDQINYREFIGGLAPLCHGSVEDKLACE